MTPLAGLLIRRIAATGPITLADYMAECLLHPQHGYYTTRDPLGAGGDFTTAPEISQMFGELIGLCLAQNWLDQGAPTPFALAELGPGRGTLMADIWRATAAVPGFHAGAQVHLVEASPTLRTAQAQRVPHATWHDSIDTLPDDRALFLVANEFFDALPIRQFRRDGPRWREIVVGLRDGALALGQSDPLSLPAGAAHLADTPADIVEFCPAAPAIMQALSSRLAAHGGAALIVDYGDWGSRGDTFQALRNHAFTDPLAEPGLADLTAHVGFQALAMAAQGVTGSAVTQGALLKALGIDARAQVLANRLTGEALKQHHAAHTRLTGAHEMGTLFKALALVRQGAPLPPGFGTP